jgi:hypothetical protein
MIRATELNEFMMTTCYERLRDFYWQQGQPDQAQHYHHLLVERLELESLAQQERNQLHLNNKFTPHDLSSIELQQLTDALSKIKDLKKAYFVKKKVDYLTHLPVMSWHFQRLVGTNSPIKSELRMFYNKFKIICH